MDLKSELSQYSFIFFTCEGANEESLLKWILDNHKNISLPDYTTDYLRKGRTKEGRKLLKEACLEYDYDGGSVVVIYLCDSRGENWELGYNVERQKINVIKIITHPEIEMLLILSNLALENEWNRQHRANKSLKPSAFCKGQFGCDVKNGANFVDQFTGFNNFVEACDKYKHRHRNDGYYCFRDIIK